MANASEARGFKRDPMFDELVPYAAWTEDSEAHHLLVDLPDFETEEIKLEVDNQDQVKISGQRKLNETKYTYFDQIFKVPENANISKTTGNFEDGILTVTVPKQEAAEEESENETANGIEENANEKPHIDGTSSQGNEKPANGHDSDREKKEEINGNVQKTWFAEEIIKKWTGKSDIVGTAIELLKKNKQILVIAVLAFSLGVYISRN